MNNLSNLMNSIEFIENCRSNIEKRSMNLSTIKYPAFNPPVLDSSDILINTERLLSACTAKQMTDVALMIASLDRFEDDRPPIETPNIIDGEVISENNSEQ